MTPETAAVELVLVVPRFLEAKLKEEKGEFFLRRSPSTSRDHKQCHT